MARGRGQQSRPAGEDSNGEVQVCPLCIEPLDADEQQFYPCPCGYQVCVFCHKKIELFCNNLCPGCRTEYGSQKQLFDPASRQSSSDTTHPAPPVPLTPAKHMLSQSAEAHTPQTQGSIHPGPKGNGLQQAGVTGWPPLWGPSSDRSGNNVSNMPSSQSPSEGASAWPSLTASQRQVPSATSHALNPSQLPSAQPQTDQSVSAWQKQQSDQQQEGTSILSNSERTRVTLPAPLTAGQVPCVQADPDGAALLQKVQSAVGNGELSIEEGTKQLVAFLRQREQTNKGKPQSGPKPPPGFATANTPAPPSSASKPQLSSQLPDTASSNHVEVSASTPLSPFPAMQPSSLSTPASMLSQLGMDTAGSRVSPQWSTASAAPAFQQWGYPQGADNHTSSSRSPLNSSSTTALASSSLSSPAGMFPVDLVAASAALWAAPAAGPNQLQSLSSLGFSQTLAPRKRRGPLYARAGPASSKGATDASPSQMPTFVGTAEGKALQQQTQWQTLGNGIFGDHLANPNQSRNGFSTNGLQSSMFAGMQPAGLDADGQQLQPQQYTNGLPANGRLFTRSGS